MPTKFSPAFDAYVEPARESAEIWRTALGFVAIACVFLLVTVGLSAAAIIVGEIIQVGYGWRLVFMLQQGTSITATFILVGSVIVLIPAVWVVMRFVHRRSFWTLISPEKRINWRLWQIGAIVVALFVIIDTILVLTTNEVEQQHAFLTWVPLALAACIVVFLQTAAEELVFRGYLQQQLAARFQSRWVWLVIPSLLFGSLHYSPGVFGGNSWLVMLVAATIGIILGDLTYRLGNLSAAMGIHFANNIFVFTLMNVKGQASGVALYLNDLDPKSAEAGNGMIMAIGIMLVIYGGFLLVWRQRRL